MTDTAFTGFDWSIEARRYRDKRTGRFVTDRKMIDARDAFVRRQTTIIDNLTRSFLDGGMSLAQWEREVAERIRIAHTAEFTFGRGGRHVVTNADRRALQRAVKAQLNYLRKFALAIQRGEQTDKQIAARARLYAKSSRASFERGRARAWGVRLPAYPGDGSTPCLTNCLCHWRYSEKPDQIEATWKLGGVESADGHCDTCLTRSRSWAPYVVKKG